MTECTKRSICMGNSSACPKPIPKPDYYTPCNENTQVCHEGKCMISICEHPHIGRNECSITFPNANRPSKYQRKKQCQISCLDADGTCRPLNRSWPLIEKNSDILRNMTDFQMIPGSRCNDGKGYCDVLDRCRDIDPEGPITRFRKLLFNKEAVMNITEFLSTRWYVVLISGIAFIAIMAAFIRCFSLHTPSSNPTLPPAYDVQGTLRRPQRTLRRMVSIEPPPAYNPDYIRKHQGQPAYNPDYRSRRNRASRAPEIEMNQLN